MKSSFYMLVAIWVTILSGCSKSGSGDTTSNNNPDPAQTVIGSWTISSYSQRTEDKTSLFKDYIFTFSAGGVLKITHNAADQSGTWSYIPASVGYYGSGGTSAAFNLNAGAIDPLVRLNRTWNISSISTSTISLVNPEPADNEVLVFTRQ
ncbi:MAG TPA: hypothetical protein VJ499_03070 [Flavisolibacter sp.]|nr:hypothetical protein [Flavisolibacter sp.]